MFGRATIRLGIGPHSSYVYFLCIVSLILLMHAYFFCVRFSFFIYLLSNWLGRTSLKRHVVLSNRT